MEKTLRAMKDHYIVCGCGRMGRVVCTRFREQGVPFVVIEPDRDRVAELGDPDAIHLIGDATQDDVLRKAGIERAKGLVALATSDTDNLFITMSARLLNADLLIVARAGAPSSDPKLRRAGANRVVSPYQMGGNQISIAALSPNVVDFLELATGTDQSKLQLSEVSVGRRCPLVGKTLSESGIRQTHGLTVLAMVRGEGETILNPVATEAIKSGDHLVVLGPKAKLLEFDRFVKGLD